MSVWRRALAVVLTVATVGGGAAASGGERPTDGDRWTAEPAWISNVGVYRGGEYVYQDYLYDDHGPNTDGIDRRDQAFGASPNPSQPTDARYSPTGGSIRHVGDFMYPAQDNHMVNAADLVEWRVTADRSAVHYLARLGALTEPDQAVLGVCVDTDRSLSTGQHTFPFGSNITTARLGCEHVYTVTGTQAWVSDAAGEATPLADLGGAVVADLDDNTIEFSVPRAVADPGRGTWRYTVASGLWDGDGWLAPAPGPQYIRASFATGGGAGNMPNIWDLLSNNREPNSTWREEKQANDLARQELSEHHIDVSFAKLARRVSEPDPQLTGVLNRIYVSRYGMKPDEGIGIQQGIGSTVNFVYKGRYQPYAMAVPSNYFTDQPRRFAFDQCLHPLNGNHMIEIYYSEWFARPDYNPAISGTFPSTAYIGFTVFPAQVDRLQTLYACVLGRGEGVGYTGGDGMVDAMEVAADVERHYRVDVNRRTLHGISLGAIGSWHMSTLYPDRYSAIMPYIFSPAIVNRDFSQLQNLLNVPTFFVNGTGDQFGQGTQHDPTADAMEELGNEYLALHYLGRQHEGRLGNDALPFAEALFYPRKRVSNPPRVRYRFDPARFSEKVPGTGEAYWVRGMTAREDGAATVDAVSLARADQLPDKQVVVRGQMTNRPEGWAVDFRALFRMGEKEFAKLWQPQRWEAGWEVQRMDVTETALERPARVNGLTAALENVGAITLDTRRMALDARKAITATLTGDGGTQVTLLGAFAKGATVALDGARVPVARVPGGIGFEVDLSGEGEHTLVVR